MSDAESLAWHQLIARVKADLAAGAPHRDEEAWRELAVRIQRLARLASLSSESSVASAEDLAQELLVEIQTTRLIDQLAASHSPTAYLMTKLRNRGLDLVRKRLRSESALARFPRPLQPDDEGTDEDRDDLYEALGARLRKLQREERELLRQRFWQGLSIREIADHRQEPYSRVAVRLFRLIRRLAQSLDGKSN